MSTICLRCGLSPREHYRAFHTLKPVPDDTAVNNRFAESLQRAIKAAESDAFLEERVKVPVGVPR